MDVTEKKAALGGTTPESAALNGSTKIAWLADLRATLREPLYRYEVRRFWTWRRYVWTALFVLAFLALLTTYNLWMLRKVLGHPGWTFGEMTLSSTITMGQSSRIPLCMLAALFGAFTMASERARGAIEQVILTPMDPWRFALAHYCARLRGLLTIWFVIVAMVIGAVLAAGVVNALTPIERWAPPNSMTLTTSEWSRVAQRILRFTMLLDLSLSMLLGAAVGLRFSLSSKSTAAAVTKTGLVAFLALPLILSAPSWIVWFLSPHASWLQKGTGPVLYQVSHLALVLLFLHMALRSVKKVAGRAFYEPETG